MFIFENKLCTNFMRGIKAYLLGKYTDLRWKYIQLFLEKKYNNTKLYFVTNVIISHNLTFIDASYITNF